MNINEMVSEIVNHETNKQLKPLREKIRKEVETYISSKGFLKSLREDVRESIQEAIDDDGVLSILSDKEVQTILRKAVRSVLK